MLKSALEYFHPSLHVREARQADIGDMLRIESECFPTPWDEGDFKHHLTLAGRCRVCLLAECSRQIVGYMLYELRISSILVVSIAVEPYFQRHGIGSLLLRHAKRKLGTSPTGNVRQSMRADVGETNLGAQLFFSRNGFRAVNVIRDFFSNGEQAYAMRYQVGRDRSTTDRKLR